MVPGNDSSSVWGRDCCDVFWLPGETFFAFKGWTSVAVDDVSMTISESMDR